MKIISVITMLWLLVVTAHAQGFPQWIGSDKQGYKENGKKYPTACYRHRFNIQARVISAVWEGEGRVYLNGGEISVEGSTVDAGSNLKTGENILGIVSKHGTLQRRVIGRLTIELEGGAKQIVQTEADGWVMKLIPKRAAEDWTWLKAAYDASQWLKVSHVDAGAKTDWALVTKSLSKRVPLWPSGRGPISAKATEPANAYLQIFHPAKPNGTAMVVCAGGGYGRNFWYGLEGVGTAKWLNQQGITAAVLLYRLPRGNHHRTHADVKRAMQCVRSQSKDLKIDSNKIGIIGYSAGGHLASTASTQYDLVDSSAQNVIEKTSSRPDFAILVYPVISLGEHTHAGTRKGWLGSKPSEQDVKQFSAHLQVTAQTPPTFLTHALDDVMVPPINSELYFKALQSHGVEAAYKPLPKGGHGFRLLKGGMGGKNWEPWRLAALEWMKKQKFIPSTNTVK